MSDRQSAAKTESMHLKFNALGNHNYIHKRTSYCECYHNNSVQLERVNSILITATEVKINIIGERVRHYQG